MTLADKALSAVGTVRTFWANFSIPCVWIAGVAFLAGGYAGYRWMKGDVEEAKRETVEAELALSNFTATLATNAATAEAAAAKRVQDATAVQAERDAAISAQIAAIPSMVARKLQPDFALFRSAIHADPVLEECLARPLPPGALGVLRREGGPITAPGD
jgi:hypothetical protein